MQNNLIIFDIHFGGVIDVNKYTAKGKNYIFYMIIKTYLKSDTTELRSSCIECCSMLSNDANELDLENIRGVCSA